MITFDYIISELVFVRALNLHHRTALKNKFMFNPINTAVLIYNLIGLPKETQHQDGFD